MICSFKLINVRSNSSVQRLMVESTQSRPLLVCRLQRNGSYSSFCLKMRFVGQNDESANNFAVISHMILILKIRLKMSKRSHFMKFELNGSSDMSDPLAKHELSILFIYNSIAKMPPFYITKLAFKRNCRT